MNTNKWIKENSFVVGVLIIGLVIFLAFWWKNSDSSKASTSLEQSWVETPAPEMAPTTAIAPAGAIEWCAQINGLQGGHVPHLLNLGVNTKQGGQNWFSSCDATGNEDWGILSDGTYFIKKIIADKAAAQLGVNITTFQIKTSENNWSQPKSGTLGTVAGQPAWVFK